MEAAGARAVGGVDSNDVIRLEDDYGREEGSHPQSGEARSADARQMEADLAEDSESLRKASEAGWRPRTG